MLQRQCPATFQVGLVEAGQCQPRTGRLEERIEKIGVAIDRRIARLELDSHAVGANGKRDGGDHDMAIDLRKFGRQPVDFHQFHAILARLEVDNERRGIVAEIEAEGHRPLQGIGKRCGDGKRQIVLQAAHQPGPLANCATAGCRIRHLALPTGLATAMTAEIK